MKNLFTVTFFVVFTCCGLPTLLAEDSVEPMRKKITSIRTALPLSVAPQMETSSG